MAEAMGMNFVEPARPTQIIAENNGSFTFGPYPTSPLDLASAYNTLAANGTQCDPSPVSEILDRDGQPLTNADGAAGGALAGAAVHARGDLAGRGLGAEPDPAARRRARPLRRDRYAGVRPRPPDRRQDRDLAGELLGRVRRLHAAVHGQRDGAQPEAEPGRRRLRWWQGRHDLARRDGADPRGPADGALPAGRPAGAGGQHQAGAGLRWRQRLRADAPGRGLPHHRRRGRQRPGGRRRRRHQPGRRFAAPCSTRRSRSRSATARTTWSRPPSRRPSPDPTPDPEPRRERRPTRRWERRRQRRRERRERRRRRTATATAADG